MDPRGGGGGSVMEALATELKRMTGIDVPVQDWQVETLPPHLRMNYRVVDDEGRTLAMDRDLSQLKARLGERAQQSFAKIPDDTSFDARPVHEWDFGDLPEQVEVHRQGLTLRGYPALADEGGRPVLRLFDTADKARTAMCDGVRRLFELLHAKDIAYLRKNLPGSQEMCLHYAAVGTCESLKDDLVKSIVARALGDASDVRNQRDFEARRVETARRLLAVGNEVCAVVREALRQYHAVAKRLKGAIQPAWLHALADLREQLDQLVFPGFAAILPYEVLAHYPRYLKAMERRLDKLTQNPTRDRQGQNEIAPLWVAYQERKRRDEAQGTKNPALETYRWMLEEYRVSLFAQELKTPQPISARRLQEQWTEVLKGEKRG